MDRLIDTFSMGVLLLVAGLATGVGAAILLTDDHLGAATPKDAYAAGSFLLLGGLGFGAWVLALYRKGRDRHVPRKS